MGVSLGKQGWTNEQSSAGCHSRVKALCDQQAKSQLKKPYQLLSKIAEMMDLYVILENHWELCILILLPRPKHFKIRKYQTYPTCSERKVHIQNDNS